MYTELTNRTLWYDGTIAINSEKIYDWLQYDKLAVDKLTNEIIQYNKTVLKQNQIIVKEELNPLDTDWNIPDTYKSIDVNQYVMDMLVNIDSELSDSEFDIRYYRVQQELKVFNKLQLYDLLRSLIYIIDTFKQENIVWGVGRGSSVASYVLFLLEVHDVDSVQFELDFSEFLE